MWLQLSCCVLAVLLLSAPTLASVCPDGCICTTTRDGLHRATCSSLAELYKFTLRQKHHNINILDLSHNNITKLSHELDRLTEVVTLDLSTNGIQDLNKFLHNAKKLVHLNLANNRIQKLSLIYLPASVSSLDLTYNNLENVPSDLGHLGGLEHLEMEGNPLDCSCENLLARDRLIIGNVLIDPVICASPEELKGKSWLELKTKDVCKVPKTKINYLDMMMGDQPLDAVQVGQESAALKPMPSITGSDLEDGKVIQSKNIVEDDDSQQFLISPNMSPSPPSYLIEGSGSGSGDGEGTTVSDYLIEPKKLHDLLESDHVFTVEDTLTTVEPLEGSGEGSGYYGFENEETTTEAFIEISPVPVQRIFDDDSNKSTTEFPIPEPPTVYQGGKNWNVESSLPEPTTQKAITSSTPRDTTVSEQIRVTQASEVLGPLQNSKENASSHKAGTYICIALIVILLVGLIGFAITKGQMRKRRDRRQVLLLLRQQKRDVEKASKEMVDMNKSLLGKPAPLEDPVERKANGKYELVPTHEVHQKKGVNSDSNGINHNEPNGVRTSSPRDSNQNKSSSKDNNLKENDANPKQETSFDSAPASPDSLSSEDIFVPINNDDEAKLNGTADSNLSQPLINGDPNTDSDYLSPSREYIPVYSPDMGRVRIKMAEIPKPKTPVLVTRSRSNAGDIIITPSEDATRTTT